MAKYVCKICGYVYDEDVESVAYDELDDSWKCPLCGAKKRFFEKQTTENPPKAVQKIHKNMIKNKEIKI